ncbi:unnamed protein product [Owenia fusiformis]|uniref:Uncharacterized protein n=1 Tax=Owenia fusiformis TaxID=6347 RepID=A0A8J1Y9M4_OWEFU|nr:unnamed protein product [Owenia fusiformis]
MAEPATVESSPDTDRDFDPSAEQLVNDFDDERTMEEDEEALSSESYTGEVNDLEKEGDMPIEQLLAMYGYGGTEPQESRSSSEEEILSNNDLTLDKDEVARDLLTEDDNKETSADDLMDSVGDVPPVSSTARLLRSQSQGSSSEEESEDEDYEPENDPMAVNDWKKTIQVGHDYQAQVPQGLCKYGDAPAYENEDRLLWDPCKLEETEVETYMKEVQQQNYHTATGVAAVPQGIHVRDDEQALYLLLQCGNNMEEALRRRKMQAVPPTDPMSLWSEEECRNFENGLKHYGKDFHLIQQNKVRTRSTGELVTFYYLWKKTERHDAFTNKNRLEKKKDYMDRFLDDQENPTALAPQRERSSSPSVNSLLFSDHQKRQYRQDGSETGHFSPIKFNPELMTGTTTMPTSLPADPTPAVSVNPTPIMSNQSELNMVHIANFTTSILSGDQTVEPSAKRLKIEQDRDPSIAPLPSPPAEKNGVENNATKIGQVVTNNHHTPMELSISGVESVSPVKESSVMKGVVPEESHNIQTAQSLAQ